MIVQVKGEVQGDPGRSQLLLENGSSVAGGVWDSLEEGPTVTSSHNRNPVARKELRVSGQLVEFPRTSLLQQQGRAAAFAWGTAVEKGPLPLGSEQRFPQDRPPRHRQSFCWLEC